MDSRLVAYTTSSGWVMGHLRFDRHANHHPAPRRHRGDHRAVCVKTPPPRGSSRPTVERCPRFGVRPARRSTVSPPSRSRLRSRSASVPQAGRRADLCCCWREGFATPSFRSYCSAESLDVNDGSDVMSRGLRHAFDEA